MHDGHILFEVERPKMIAGKRRARRLAMLMLCRRAAMRPASASAVGATAASSVRGGASSSSSAAFASRPPSAAAWRAYRYRAPSSGPRRITRARVLVGASSEVVDFYEDEEVAFSKSNDFRNDALSDDGSIEAAREALQPHFPFGLDDWQLSAGASILADRNVIVCAPTG